MRGPEISNEQRAKKLAEEFRTKHGLGDGPIKDMFELVHGAVGVDVISMQADEAEHGLSMIDPASGRTVIAVATTPHPMRQRSSIAHELGHLVAGDLEGEAVLTPGERNPAEICADAFARHLLLPLAGANRHCEQIAEAISLQDLSDLVQEFEVSPRMATIQLRKLGRIDTATGEEWGAMSAAHLAARFGWLNQYRSLATDSERPRAPQRLMTRAVEGYRRGVVGLTELARWYGMDASELEEQLGQVPEVEVELGDDWDSDAPLFPGGKAGPAT